MKKLMTVAGIVLVMVLAVSCNRGGNTSRAQAPAVVDYSQHETFSVWLFADIYDEYSDYSENPIVWALNRKFNVTLRFEQPVRGTERDAMALMFGTGEYTDMIEMSNYTGSIPRLFEEGVIVDIAEYLDYMPNFKRLMETDDDFRRLSYNDDGQILTLRMYSDPYEILWSGLMYRHDILERQTNGNVRFPSGNNYPKTIDDWEYMHPLFVSYFETRGTADYAPLILPYNGNYYYGEFANSFGAQSSYYIEDDRVYYGFYEDPFYKYLQKMREWYSRGWIYKDFASRVNDRFYLPNPGLVYGGNAGAWIGLTGQVGDSMSMPQYGMYFDVRAAPSPLSVTDGIYEVANFQRNPVFLSGGVGYSFTTACRNLPKLLNVMDHLYSREGMFLRSGLTRETGSEENRVYVRMGVEDGFYWWEGETLVVNPKIDEFSSANRNSLFGNRLPGLVYQRMDTPEGLARRLANDETWDPYPDAKRKLLQNGVVSRTIQEDTVFAANAVAIDDYINSTLPQFIMGTLPLNPQSWADYKARLRALGVEDNIRIQQAAYDRYLRR